MGWRRSSDVSDAGGWAGDCLQECGARTRRRKLAAAWLGWCMGRSAGCEGCEHWAAAPGEFRLYGRVVGDIQRPFRGSAAEGCYAVVRCTEPAWRGDGDAIRHRGRRHLCALV